MANLQPLYEIKERLEHAAIAGTGLLAEDFRLTRGVEALAPLAKASPVFAKIDQGVRALLAAPAEERGGALLDTLALVDAVAYTQGITGGQGELAPLAAGSGVYCPASYGQLHPLVEALTGTGGGRIGLIQDAWENHPEYFGDFRVLPLLVEGLGDSYAELADLLAAILEAQGPGIIPLLKRGFDPAGKRDMARRAALIDKLAGAAENDFYLDQLETAKKPVRGALLLALRHDIANGPRLAALCQSERGDNQAAARWALARSKAPEAWDYWRALADKDPDKALEFMRGSRAEMAQDLTAVLFTETMERLRADPRCPLDKDLWERVNHLRLALVGKEGPDIADCYRQAAALGRSLDRKMTDKKEFVFLIPGFHKNQPFSGMIPLTLHQSLLEGADLCDLAAELYEKYGDLYAAPAICAALLRQDSGEALRRAKSILGGPAMLLRKERRTEILQTVFWCLCWNQEKGRYEYSFSRSDPGGLDGGQIQVPLAAPLDGGWYDLLMKAEQDHILHSIFCPERRELLEPLGNYFYKRVTEGRDRLGLWWYCSLLMKCGWTRWEGLVAQWAQKTTTMTAYTVIQVLRDLPISNPEKAAELRRVSDVAAKRAAEKAYGRSFYWPHQVVENQLAQWEA